MLPCTLSPIIYYVRWLTWDWSTRPGRPGWLAGSEIPIRYAAWAAFSVRPHTELAKLRTLSQKSSNAPALAWLEIPVIPSARLWNYIVKRNCLAHGKSKGKNMRARVRFLPFLKGFLNNAAISQCVYEVRLKYRHESGWSLPRLPTGYFNYQHWESNQTVCRWHRQCCGRRQIVALSASPR